MKPQEQFPAGAKVFIAGLRFFEIVYLPATGEVTSRMGATGPVAEDVETPQVSPEGMDDRRPEES